MENLERKTYYSRKTGDFSYPFCQCCLPAIFVLLWWLLRRCVSLLFCNKTWVNHLHSSSMDADPGGTLSRKTHLGSSGHESSAMSSPRALISLRSASRSAWMSPIIWFNFSSLIVDLREEERGQCNWHNCPIQAGFHDHKLICSNDFKTILSAKAFDSTRVNSPLMKAFDLSEGKEGSPENVLFS